MIDDQVLYAWYSELQSASAGVIQYETVDGHVVRVTSATPTDDHRSNFSDIRFVAMVKESSARRLSY